MGPDYERRPAIDKVSEGHFLAGRLGVEIQQDRVNIAA
jgi:hypothetical protein